MSTDLSEAFNSYFENYFGIGISSGSSIDHAHHASTTADPGLTTYTHPAYRPTPQHATYAIHAEQATAQGQPHPGFHSAHHEHSSASSSRLTPSSPALSAFGSGPIPLHGCPVTGATATSASASIQPREGTLTPLTTVGSGSSSDSGNVAADWKRASKKLRQDNVGARRPDGHALQAHGSEAWLGAYPAPCSREPSIVPLPHPLEAWDAYAYPPLVYDEYSQHPTSMSSWPYDEEEFLSVSRMLSDQHEQQAAQRRRGKFTATRRYRAGETVRVRVQGQERQHCARSRADRSLNQNNSTSSVSPLKKSRSGRAADKKWTTTVTTRVERNLDRVRRADEPPQAYLEVHTLFVRPPASVYEERERERVRERRRLRLEPSLGARRFVDHLGVKTEDDDSCSDPAVARRQVALRPGRRRYGPESAQWHYDYSDGLGIDGTQRSQMAKAKTEIKEEDADATTVKRKRGRPAIEDALEVALRTGTPLHPWAEPLPEVWTAKHKREEEAADTSTAVPQDVKAPRSGAPSQPETRRGLDPCGRPCELPLPSVQPPYSKTLRERYRAYTSPNRARLDLHALWTHRARHPLLEDGVAESAPWERRNGAAPIFLQRNLGRSRSRAAPRRDCN